MLFDKFMVDFQLLTRQLNMANYVNLRYKVVHEKTDARKLKPEAQQQLRNQAIRLRKRGFPIAVDSVLRLW